MTIQERLRAVISNIGGRVNRGMDAFRDQPALPTTPAMAAAVMPPEPAQAISAFRPFNLRLADFSALETWRANEEIRLASYAIPENHELYIPKSALFTLYVPSVNRLNGQNLGAPANRAVSISTLAATTLASGWSGPSTYHPEVAVFALVSGTWTACSVVSVVGTTVTFVEPASVANAADNIRIYYFDTRGDVAIQQTRNNGSMARSSSVLINDSLSAIHQTNQIDGESARRWPADYTLAQKQSVIVAVKTPQEIVLNDQARQIAQLEIPAFIRELVVFDDRRLAAAKELENRRGL